MSSRLKIFLIGIKRANPVITHDAEESTFPIKALALPSGDFKSSHSRSADVRYLIRIAPPSGQRRNFLATLKSVAMATGTEARNPKWTSYGSLELDIFVRTRADFETFAAAAEPLGTLEFVRDLNRPPKHMSEEELFAEARSQFNAERYWEAHETLEGAWRNLSGEEKSYVQGIILVCAAFVHAQKGEEEVALSVLKRALKQLDFESPSYHGIDTLSLKRNAGRILTTRRFEPFRV